VSNCSWSHLARLVFEAEAQAGVGMLLAQLRQPFPQDFGFGVNGDAGPFAGAGVEETEVGLFVRAIQADIGGKFYRFVAVVSVVTNLALVCLDILAIRLKALRTLMWFLVF
jgi:hypothetical protein